MTERTAWFEKRGITKGRYMELKGIASQYDWMKRQEKKLQAGEIDRNESGNVVWRKKDPTGNAAIGLVSKSYAPRIKAIEDSAKAADAFLWKYILRCVCRGESWEKMQPPCGRRQFHARRRLFFAELDKRV